MNRGNLKKTIGINATHEEQRIFDYLRDKMQRLTNSDVIRALIREKALFFATKSTIVTNNNSKNTMQKGI